MKQVSAILPDSVNHVQGAFSLGESETMACSTVSLFSPSRAFGLFSKPNECVSKLGGNSCRGLLFLGSHDVVVVVFAIVGFVYLCKVQDCFSLVKVLSYVGRSKILEGRKRSMEIGSSERRWGIGRDACGKSGG